MNFINLSTWKPSFQVDKLLPMNYEWRYQEKISDELIRQFPQYSPLILQLLHNRGLKTQVQIDEFFNPDYEKDIHSPFLMKDMKRAVERIFKALKKQEKIVVFGDYDVDGVCSALILKNTLEEIGFKQVGVYIPDRVSEGHGLNETAIKELAKNKVQLIITTDCGSSNFQEIKLAHSLGLEVIITDHHPILEKMPPTKFILNFHRADETYPFKNLAGAGVAYKFASALISQAQERKIKISMAFEKWLLDLVALATVTDLMPLLGENRTLVKYGLIVLGQTQRVGLRELIKQAGLSNNLTTYDLGYILGPRLNAAGRMDHANMAYELLATRSPEEAEWLVQRLTLLNQERQGLVEKIIQEAEARRDRKTKFIFEGDADWPLGVLGLVAGKLADKYHQPVIIFNQDAKEIKASARSIPQFHIGQALHQCAKWLEKYGGHAGAGGFTLLNKNKEEFKKCFGQIISRELKEEDVVPVIEIEAEAPPQDFNWQMYDQLQLFAPFGQNNPQPFFSMKGLKVNEARLVGNSHKHLKLNLASSIKANINAIAFNFSEWYEKLKTGDSIDIVFEFLVNEWNGTRNLEMKILDLKLSV